MDAIPNRSHSRFVSFIWEAAKLVGIALVCLLVVGVVIVLFPKTGIIIPSRWFGLFVIALGAGVGAAAGAAIQALVRRRRLRRLGFTSADLSSRETFFKKWAEITVQKMPEKISFSRIDSHSWSKASEYAHARAALEKLGLERNPVFVASPQKWVVEFWLGKDDGIFAAILDSPPCGVHTEFIVSYKDGSTLAFENTEDCGRRHIESHNSIHCGTVGPEQLLERALQERQADHLGPMGVDDCVQSYERATNESLAWRRRVGFSREEMKHTYERLRRKRSFLARLP